MATNKLTDTTDISKRIANIIKTKSLTKREIASKLSISAAHVTNLSLGKSKASGQLVKLIDEIWPDNPDIVKIEIPGGLTDKELGSVSFSSRGSLATVDNFYRQQVNEMLKECKNSEEKRQLIIDILELRARRAKKSP